MPADSTCRPKRSLPADDTDTMIVKNISKGMELAVQVFIDRPDWPLLLPARKLPLQWQQSPVRLVGSTLTQIETEHIPVKVLSFNVIKPTLGALAKGKYPHTVLIQRHGHT